jgi:hypothetical protein
MSRFTSAIAHNQLPFANKYLLGILPAAEAASQLSPLGIPGRLLAAEVLWDQASRDTPDTVSAWLGAADVHYRAVMEATDQLTPEADDYASRVRAGMRLAQYAVVRSLYTAHRLPQERSMTEDMYARLLEHATVTSEAEEPYRRDRSESHVGVRALLGDMAVFLLAQRIGLRGDATNKWLPLQATLSESRISDYSAGSDRETWDMSIFSADQENAAYLEYQLLIRSSQGARLSSTDRQFLYVFPDLALFSSENGVTSNIIKDCNAEMGNGEEAVRAAQDLDIRTTKLLKKLH